jgi:hypothetical protein
MSTLPHGHGHAAGKLSHKMIVDAPYISPEVGNPPMFYHLASVPGQVVMLWLSFLLTWWLRLRLNSLHDFLMMLIADVALTKGMPRLTNTATITLDACTIDGATHTPSVGDIGIVGNLGTAIGAGMHFFIRGDGSVKLSQIALCWL